MIATPPTTPKADEPKPARVMPLGDSLTMASPGYRAPLAKLLADAGHEVEFVGSMTDDKPPRLKHEGHGGFTIGPGKSKADAWAAPLAGHEGPRNGQGKGNLSDNLDVWPQEKPDVILLLIGTNDFFNVGDLQPGYDPNKQGPERLGALLDRIHKLSPDTRVLVSSVLPVAWDAEFAKGFNAAIPALVKGRKFAAFADLNKAVGFREGDWSADKLHPTERGYGKLAKAWFDELVPVLKARK